MAGWIELAIALLAIVLMWHFISVRFRRPRAGPAGDPEALVGAGLKHPPGSRSGAVALDEPDEE